jgi:ComF family protein
MGGEILRADAQDDSAKVCGMCERQRPPYERALAYGPYDGALRDLVHLLKYARVHTAAPVLGRMLAEAIVGLGIETDAQLRMVPEKILVVPVPLYQSKQKQRGFNQALEVTRAALKLMAPVARGKYELAAERLLRVRDTLSQTGLTRHQRRENVRGAFVASNPDSLKGATVLLVDDVFTTGTTVTECAKVLRRAGAGKVFVATVARVLKNDAALVDLHHDDFDESETTTKTMAAHV